MSERRVFLKNASLLPLAVLPALAHGEAVYDDQPTAGLTPLPQMPDLPQSSPAQEQPFPDYHLLGNADSAGNLFGAGARPKRFQCSDSGVWQADADNDVNECIRIASMVLNQRLVRFCRQTAPMTIQEMHCACAFFVLVLCIVFF
jgi:hypothetical protein